jgi:four helix bundle protein
MDKEKDNLIKKKSFEFALLIIDLYKKLTKQSEFIISKQLLRSATSIGANVEEAIGAQSRKDFIHKLSISLKEARETRYWLLLLDEGKLTSEDCLQYTEKANEIIAILTKIIKTTGLS